MVNSHSSNGLRGAVVCTLALVVTSCGITPTLPSAAEFTAEREQALQLRYFGATTLTISDGTKTVMIDGYFSRPGLGTLASCWRGACMAHAAMRKN